MRALAKGRPILVKRYARSRLYDATNRRYVSIEQLRAWVAEGGVLRHRRRRWSGHHPHSAGLTIGGAGVASVSSDEIYAAPFVRNEGGVSSRPKRKANLAGRASPRSP